jgi:hypothetical protein
LEHDMILIPVLDWAEWRFRTGVLEEDPHPRLRGIPYLNWRDRITVFPASNQRKPVFCHDFVR